MVPDTPRLPDDRLAADNAGQLHIFTLVHHPAAAVKAHTLFIAVKLPVAARLELFATVQAPPGAIKHRCPAAIVIYHL
jgi:hypothetical protein